MLITCYNKTRILGKKKNISIYQIPLLLHIFLFEYDIDIKPNIQKHTLFG